MNQGLTEKAEIFKAFGDKTRLEILNLLGRCGNHRCVGSLAEELNISQPTVSQHLKVLKNAGLVGAEKKGVFVHYSLNREFMKALAADLTQLCEQTPGKCKKTK